MKGLLFVDFKIYKVYFNSNTGFRAILRSNDKNHYKQGDRDDNEAGTGSAETLEPLSRFIERSCAGRTGQGLAGRIPPDDTEPAADRTHGGEIQQIHRASDQGAVFGVRFAPDHVLFRVDAVASVMNAATAGFSGKPRP